MTGFTPVELPVAVAVFVLLGLLVVPLFDVSPPVRVLLFFSPVLAVFALALLLGAVDWLDRRLRGPAQGSHPKRRKRGP